MPWSIEKRESRWCVIKQGDGSVEGCHDSRTDAIKQQRALYANESRMASMYAELDALPIEELVDLAQEVVQAPSESVPESTLSPFATELVGLILKDEREKSLTASLAQSMDAIAERMAAEKMERSALVAALSQIGQPVINVPAPEIHVDVPTPEVKVDVQAPEVTVNVPEAKFEIPTPEVTVNVEAPASTRTVTFERDVTGRLSKAEIAESS